MEYNSGWVSGVLEILTPSYSGGANKDFWRGTMSGRNANSNDPYTLSNTLPWSKAFYEQVRPKIEWMQQRIAESKRVIVPVHASAPAPSSPDLAEQIAKLAELHRSGVLDDDEFRSAKARLLSDS